ncbi:death domain-associated protein 6 isoform X2 [Dendropsophus ebraccatus]|uniref:death domain-associated protein 6 isoform X2 n=1 Tax=Dendropsophus ebraccatus TaxID=150705 RepID=UPI0038321A13
MSHMNEIIVLDDDDEEPPKPAKAKAVIHNPSKQTNGKAEESGGSSHKKKAEVISAENKALFSEFIDYCSKLTTENPEVITFLQGRYDKASPSYLDSVEFRNTVGRCLTRVQTKRSKIFVYINELCTALKANSQKRKVSLQTQALQQPTTEKTETQTLMENDAAETEKSPVKKTGSKRQIRYLENLLRIYSLEIKKLQEKELSLDELDDEDSSYIQEARLKRKLLRIFEKLCEIKDCNSLTGRVIEQRILYRGTRYPEVNRRLERFINCDRDIFPDYTDILREVERVNDKHHLSLSRKQMQSMAQDAFRELGNKLQDRRHLDMIYNFGCHLTDCYKSVNDPAQQDTSLSRRLRENRNTAMSRLDDIIRKYADMQDDGEDDHRMKTRRGPEKTKQSSSEASEEEEESEDSETDIEEELEQSNEQVDSEEEENEEEIAADQENEADQKMDMASGAEDSEKGKEDGGDDENVMEEQEEATEQESSPASTSASSSNDKDSPNTTLESEAEAQLPASPDLPPLSNDPPDKAKSDEEHNEEPEAPESITPTDTADQMEEEQEHNDSVPSPVDKGSEENEDAAASVIPPCDSPSDIQVYTTKHNTQYFLPDMTVSIEKDEDDSGEDEGVAGPADDQSSEGDASETSLSPAVQEETDANENIEESSVKRKRSIDSEAASMEEEPACTDMAENDEDDDNNDNSDNDDEGDDNGDDNDGDNNNDDDHLENSAASRGQSPSNSLNAEQEETATSAHTDTADPDPCEKETDCDLSPVGSSNGVHTATQVQSTSLNRLKLNKDKATLRDSPKPRNTQEASPPPNRKRKGMFPKKWTNNGLTRYNGKEYTEGHKEKKCKRAKMDCSYTSLSSSSDSDSDSFEEDERTPGLMMTCSPRETPKKSIIKSNVSTQCDPDEVIVLSD